MDIAARPLVASLKGYVWVSDGTPVVILYAPEAPCVNCGKPVWEESSGGVVVCPACDCGRDRKGNPLPLRIKGNPRDDRYWAEMKARRAAYFEDHPERRTQIVTIDGRFVGFGS